jgi:hypothetical protein
LPTKRSATGHTAHGSDTRSSPADDCVVARTSIAATVARMS